MSPTRFAFALAAVLGVTAAVAPVAADPGAPLSLRLPSITGGVQGDDLAPSDGSYRGGAYMETPRGHHEHDGFYLRIHVGPSAVAAVADDELETSVSGTGGAFGLAAGVALAPNFIVYGELMANTALSPTIESGVLEVETSEDTAFSLIGVGPGMALYLPGNFYLSSTLAFTRLVLDPDTEETDDEATSDLGVTLTAAIGKEWWVSSNWGLGAALQLYGGAMKDGDAVNDNGEDVVWGAGGVLLAFSATLN
jgi:hypothetical protein